MANQENHQKSDSLIKCVTRKVLKNWKLFQDFRLVAERFFPYFRKNVKRLMFAQIAGLGYIVMGMLEPWPLKLIFDNVFLSEPLPQLLSPLVGFLNNRPVSLLAVLIGAIIVLLLPAAVDFSGRTANNGQCTRRSIQSSSEPVFQLS
jgi:hypothetical protein